MARREALAEERSGVAAAPSALPDLPAPWLRPLVWFENLLLGAAAVGACTPWLWIADQVQAWVGLLAPLLVVQMVLRRRHALRAGLGLLGLLVVSWSWWVHRLHERAPAPSTVKVRVLIIDLDVRPDLDRLIAELRGQEADLILLRCPGEQPGLVRACRGLVGQRIRLQRVIGPPEQRHRYLLLSRPALGDWQEVLAPAGDAVLLRGRLPLGGSDLVLQAGALAVGPGPIAFRRENDVLLAFTADLPEDGALLVLPPVTPPVTSRRWWRLRAAGDLRLPDGALPRPWQVGSPRAVAAVRGVAARCAAVGLSDAVQAWSVELATAEAGR